MSSLTKCLGVQLPETPGFVQPFRMGSLTSFPNFGDLDLKNQIQKLMSRRIVWQKSKAGEVAFSICLTIVEPGLRNEEPASTCHTESIARWVEVSLAF